MIYLMKNLNERLNKLIKYSNIDKNKKTIFIWPEGALSGKYFFELAKYKKKLKKIFHQIILFVLE